MTPAQTPPDVSIVLTTHNRGHVLQQTLDMVAAQTYAHFEVIVCDDFSSDNTEQVCREYVKRDSRFKYLRHPKRSGMPANVNAGLRQAQYEFVANLHDGDVIDPTLIEKWRAALIKYPSAGFVFNRYRHLREDGDIVTVFPIPELMKGVDFLDWVFKDPALECPVWGCAMSRRSIYHEMGFFDPRYSFWADMDMWYRIAGKYDVAHVPEPLIGLPGRKALPHTFDPMNLGAHWNMFRLMWAAKQRRYRGHPAKTARAFCNQTFGFGSVLAGRASRKLVRIARARLAASAANSAG
jgi:glycosyltransferase involved in cell wall biosynthesis